MIQLSQATASPLGAGLAVVSLISVSYLCLKLFRRSTPLPFPPGPPREPIIGSLRSFPLNNWYPKFCEWQSQYGDLVFLTLPGIPLLILNSIESMDAILNKKASSNSNRMVGYMVWELMGWHWSLAFMPQGPAHHLGRKMLRRGIGPQRIPAHHPLLEAAATKMVVELNEFEGDPENVVNHVIGSIVIKLTYGEEIWNSFGEELIAINKEALHLAEMALLSFWPVDILHFLRFLPDWFPGTGFKRVARRSSYLANRMRTWPYGKVQELYASGKSGNCLATDLFDEFGMSEATMNSLGMVYVAGVDTTSGAIYLFLHAMLMFPHVAQKIQKELHEVVGVDRLPKIDDRANLPYLEAAWKESLRWSPIIPIGIPHVTTKDDSYNGLYIPKGTVINTNVGFVLRDPRTWRDPETFLPERFLKGSEFYDDQLPDPASVVFGFGMRVCPGVHLADATAFLILSTIMSVFDIKPVPGSSIPTSFEYTDGGIRLPKDFKCAFRPRSEKAREIITALSQN